MLTHSFQCTLSLTNELTGRLLAGERGDRKVQKFCCLLSFKIHFFSANDFLQVKYVTLDIY